jgi:hypothetical protein
MLAHQADANKRTSSEGVRSLVAYVVVVQLLAKVAAAALPTLQSQNARMLETAAKVVAHRTVRFAPTLSIGRVSTGFPVTQNGTQKLASQLSPPLRTSSSSYTLPIKQPLARNLALIRKRRRLRPQATAHQLQGAAISMEEVVTRWRRIATTRRSGQRRTAVLRIQTGIQGLRPIRQ